MSSGRRDLYLAGEQARQQQVTGTAEVLDFLGQTHYCQLHWDNDALILCCSLFVGRDNLHLFQMDWAEVGLSGTSSERHRLILEIVRQ